MDSRGDEAGNRAENTWRRSPNFWMAVGLLSGALGVLLPFVWDLTYLGVWTLGGELFVAAAWMIGFGSTGLVLTFLSWRAAHEKRRVGLLFLGVLVNGASLLLGLWLLLQLSEIGCLLKPFQCTIGN